MDLHDYFIYPYAEIDGTPHQQIRKKCSYDSLQKVKETHVPHF